MKARSANGSSRVFGAVVTLVFFIVILTASACGGQFVGSLVFAKLEKLPPSVAGITTLHSYWSAYGHIEHVRRALVVGTFVSIFIAFLPAAVVVMALAKGLRRELHGSARFATVREIRESGLVGNEQ